MLTPRANINAPIRDVFDCEKTNEKTLCFRVPQISSLRQSREELWDRDWSVRGIHEPNKLTFSQPSFLDHSSVGNCTLIAPGIAEFMGSNPIETNVIFSCVKETITCLNCPARYKDHFSHLFCFRESVETPMEFI